MKTSKGRWWNDTGRIHFTNDRHAVSPGLEALLVFMTRFFHCTVYYSPSVNRREPTLEIVVVCTISADNRVFGFLYLLTPIISNLKIFSPHDNLILP